MSEQNNGGPAFPCTEENYRNPKWTSKGLSMRDYFAAKAMQGMLAGQVPLMKEEDALNKVSRTAYLLADAMLKARG